MNVTIYEEATWYEIERNKMHLKRDGEHYVADAMLLRESANLRQENDSLKKENEGLRKEIDRLVMNSTPTATELRRVRSEWKKDRDQNAKLREICADMWRLLLATGNDDLVLSIEANGVVKEIIDAEELAKAMRELGIEV